MVNRFWQLSVIAVLVCFLSTNLYAQTISDTSLFYRDVYGWVHYLADDRLNGRAEGTAENREVTDSIARYFGQLGLQPYFNTGFLHGFADPENSADTSVSNVIAVLPGSEKPEEFILLSAHFDHVQFGYRQKKDKIYNGANDNASGTAVLLALARQLSLMGPQKRSILFCAFNAEESGLIGSIVFSKHLDARKIIAGLNFEMLGRPQFGKASFMLTGMHKSDLHRILKKNLKDEKVYMRNERGDLFERSDNYPLALKGIPAHTLMASDDREPCYHRPCDEVGRLNIDNMVVLGKAFLKGMSSLLDGTDTPQRITLRAR